jgi:hypothetical protein
MNAKGLNALLIALLICFGWSIAWSAQSPFPANATFTTLVKTPLVIEGLTGDGTYLYAAARQITLPGTPTPPNNNPCPIYRVKLVNPPSVTPVLETIGYIPASNNALPCNPAGVAFDSLGRLFIAESQGALTDSSRKVYVLDPPFTPETTPGSAPTAAVYALDVPGANGIAFKGSNLWISDGTTNQGRVWKVGLNGGNCDASSPVPTPVNCVEVFRIQPMTNDDDLGGLLLNGVGRVNSTIQQPPAANNPQNLVANGLAFNAQGNLLVADSARGALWLVTFDNDGNLVSKRGCDETFDRNTLCLENLFRADPRLEGVDGIALDVSGDVWASVNERNAIVFTVFFGTSNSVEVFRNPVNSSGLRNSATDNTRILEFPTSPFLSGTKFCTANSDNNRRDNSPSNAGEIGGAGAPLGKISCMDQALGTSGLPLPR